MIQQVQTEERVCPICKDEDGLEIMVEPEVDGEHRYWECEECGYAWGYERVDESTRIEGNCSIGVPESVRKSASAPMQKAMADEQKAQPIPISIGRRPE